ncbi:MAG: hypothetical protein LBU00_03990 [Treponema sp.]|nr:hypothetical protein [Treponema sp.]
MGAIFRNVNIVEYKSPEASLSLEDYHKVLAYAYLYCSLHGLKSKNVTISFVITKCPQDLMSYFREELGYEVEEKWPGIYHVKGGEFGGMQVVLTRKLREEDGGLWLKGLREDLKGEELREILEKSRGMPKGSPLAAYLWIVAGANKARFKELMTMSSAFEEVLEECGLIEKWEDRGREDCRVLV